MNSVAANTDGTIQFRKVYSLISETGQWSTYIQSAKINKHMASTETFCLWLTLNHAMLPSIRQLFYCSV